MNREHWFGALIRGYKGSLLIAFALSPLPLIAYVQAYQDPSLRHHSLLGHELLIGLAIAVSAVVTYVSYRCYQASGEPILRWLTLGLLGMTLVYAPHGILTRLAVDNPPMFLLFGPASRCVMALFWLIAFWQLRAPPENPRKPALHWWYAAGGLLLVDALVLVIASNPDMPRMQTRIVLESAAVALNLAGLALLLRRIHLSPLLQFFALSLCFFMQASLSFFLAAPWNHQWWLAHGVFAAGFLTMSFGLVRAFLTTGKLVEVFSEEQLMRQLEAMATTDELTGLPNRREFLRRFDRLLEPRNPADFAVFVLDLDDFKVINDSMGHEAGDGLLKTVSQRLLSTLRPGDTLARLGGDEFALLLPGLGDETQAAHAAERMLIAMNEPIVFNGKRIHPRGSLGISLHPGDGLSSSALLKAADAAMYESKQGGRHRFSFHTAEMNARASARMQTEHELRDGIRLQQFALHYQPQIEMSSGRIIAAEALLRWEHPEFGCISAGRFIEIAEASGLMVDLGQYVLERACADLAKMRPHLPKTFRLAVNLSGHQLLAGDAYTRIMNTIADKGLSGEQLQLELEVTESTLLRSPLILDILTRLRQQGIQMAIDDFGTGYSSLAQLHELPVNRLKIAGRFIEQMPYSESSRCVVRTIIQLGRDMGLKVLAEGVETQQQADWLLDAGCDEAQGFLFYPALDRKQFLSVLPPLEQAV